jgi:hypothetical protein
MDKLTQLVGIVLLFLVGLGGSEYIYGKKRACSMEGWWKGRTQEGQLIVRISIFKKSYNQPGTCNRKKYYINGY